LLREIAHVPETLPVTAGSRPCPGLVAKAVSVIEQELTRHPANLPEPGRAVRYPTWSEGWRRQSDGM